MSRIINIAVLLLLRYLLLYFLVHMLQYVIAIGLLLWTDSHKMTHFATL